MRSLTSKRPEKSLTNLLKKNSGRNSTGKITVRHQGGRQKRFYRLIDFRRDKFEVPGKIVAFEYDPNRNVDLALVYYTDGEKRYILSPQGLTLGEKILSGKSAEPKTGNALPMSNIPIGLPIHNVELHPGRGGQIVRSAGTVAQILAKEHGVVHLKLPSGEVRKIKDNCLATVGQLGNAEWKDTPIGKAGRSRLMGRRPEVRGTAMHPASHPHGGGEGRSGVGLKSSKTPWGKVARGLRTRKKRKYSDKYIITRRKK
ncbi:50S ribosomal protein L2 [Candidatus Gottesmanbacteria bacterium RBG_16_37_8]|uniref:Large ribosomal subunit protein uL2 n=1 Tax=Candidatus Gottesmanbacteria bacterium RBG_16_37_8 TaxID=1798371 RepID=A0A1F5YTD1_9BACT|nr:MAG: 50S ribosomal protein L2 [Candidatus Gottesmanbacteria bacterium RBG_16_37_8]